MFYAARPISPFLGRTERARLHHTPQSQERTPLLPHRAPPQRDVEWGFVDDSSAKSETDIDSESSASMSSSDMSENIFLLPLPHIPPGRPSSLHYKVPNETELEPFPDFVARNDRFPLSEDAKHHCVLHCPQTICKKTVYLDGKKGIEHTCTGTCSKPSISRPDKTAISRLTRSTAKAAYATRQEDQELTIHHPTALKLILHMRRNRLLDIHTLLFASQAYTRATILEPKNYKHAAIDASARIIGGLEDSLKVMLRYMPEQTRVMKVGELEELLMALAHWDCADWMRKWVWTEKRKRPVSMKRLYRGTVEERGVRVLVERVEEGVQDVVGALVWWDGEGKGTTST